MNVHAPSVTFFDNRTDARQIAARIVADLEKSSYLDVATGFFEIGGLLQLEAHWERLDKIRILMGSALGERTRKILTDRFLPEIEARFREGLDDERRRHPLLERIRAVASAFERGQIECRVHVQKGKKFHAKAFLTGDPERCSVAQVGSSNFTAQGLTRNTELNARFTDPASTSRIQEWFDDRWEESEEFTDQLAEILRRLVREYSPYEVYLKASLALLEGKDATGAEWEENHSNIFPLLDECQKRGYREVLGKVRKHGGAFLCDGVGMGKTFVGLMLIEKFCRHEKKNVALFAPKSALESVWKVEVPSRLEGLKTAYGNRLTLHAHTDFQRTREGDIDYLNQVRDEADVVIIDESHYFRNRGKEGKSRYWQMRRLLESPDGSRKPVVLLTATPINNSLEDFRNQLDLITGDAARPDSMPPEIGSVPAYLKALEKEIELAKQDPSHNPLILREKVLFKEVVTQRSRSFAKELQERDPGARELLFPVREKPRVASYSITKACGSLLERLRAAFDRREPELQFSVYNSSEYAKSEEDEVEVNRQRQLVGLIRTLFVKRLESSICAFESSCLTVLKKMLAWCLAQSDGDKDLQLRLQEWRKQYGEVIGIAGDRLTTLWDDSGEPTKFAEEDVIPPELVDEVEVLDVEDFDLPRMFGDVLGDMRVLSELLRIVDDLEGDQDLKFESLLNLISSDEDLVKQKVMIFTEFADTAKYLEKRLIEAGVQGVEAITSRSNKPRRDVVQRFSPFYNGTTSVDLQVQGKREIEVLISTDMLAEGLNLHDASRLINYDIHWNPVQIIQRVGRVDRRLNPEIEAAIAVDREEQGLRSDRGRVVYWNFLPPDDLAPLISLMETVSGKTLTISKTLGIQTGHLLSSEDQLDEIEELSRYEEFLDGAQTVEERIALRLTSIRGESPELLDRVRAIPHGVLSGKDAPDGARRGVFFCYRLPGRDVEATTTGEVVWSLEAGSSRWYLFDMESEQVLEDPAEILQAIECEPGEPRKRNRESKTLEEIKSTVDAHINRAYLRPADVPQGVEPDLITWMELN